MPKNSFREKLAEITDLPEGDHAIENIIKAFIDALPGESYKWGGFKKSKDRDRFTYLEAGWNHYRSELLNILEVLSK